MIKFAILGHGVVGSGVAEVFFKNKESIESKAGDKMELAHILDLRDFPGLPYSELFTKDFSDILNDDEVKIVVEVMGGVNPAFDFVKQCLENGKSVATSNKELVAVKGAELINIAKKNNVNFLFEASVGGGIPILRPLTQCLAANEIEEIDGILNGTTNYILTQMINEGVDFEDALKTAQKLGYAERNPEADIEGFDACRKICILSALAFGKHVYPEQVYTEGITKISLTDVALLSSIGSVIKLIGRTRKDEKTGKVFATVYPAVLNKHCQLSSVEDVYNAILVKGDAIGDVMFYGKGAGKLPTASAVVADIIDCAKHIHARKYVYWDDGSSDYVENYKNDTVAVYYRVSGCDKAEIEKTFGSVTFIETKDISAGDVAFITEPMQESVSDEKSALLKGKIVSRIRVLNI